MRSPIRSPYGVAVDDSAYKAGQDSSPVVAKRVCTACDPKRVLQSCTGRRDPFLNTTAASLCAGPALPGVHGVCAKLTPMTGWLGHLASSEACSQALDSVPVV